MTRTSRTSAHRSRLTTALLATLTAATLTVGPAQASPTASPTASPGQDGARASSPAARSVPITNRAFFNNPFTTVADSGEAGNSIDDLFIARFDGAPEGSVVRMMVYNLTSSGVAAAMVAAVERGVEVKLIIDKQNCGTTATRQVREAVDGEEGSFVRCFERASRTARDGISNIHSKYVTFSATSGREHVTLVGSANPTDEAYTDQWNDMYQYVGRKDVHDRYAHVFDVSKKKPDLDRPFRQYAFNNGQSLVQFYPVNAERPGRDDDPVAARLAKLSREAVRGGRVDVAVYAMFGPRAQWLKDGLVRLERQGLEVRVIAGPPTGTDVVSQLRKAGIRVVRAGARSCEVADSNCNYSHLKLMTARWRTATGTQYRVWTGSDNWNAQNLVNDEVVHKIGGRAAYDQYAGLLDRVVRKHRG